MPIDLSTLDHKRMTRRSVVAGAAGAALSAAAFGRGMAQTPEASPEGDALVGDARERLRDSLSLLPSSVVDPAAFYFDWIDYRQQFAAVGVDDPYDESVVVDRYLMALGSGDELFTHRMNPVIEDLLGFRPLDLHHVLYAGNPPETFLVYHGGVPFDDLTHLWEAAGYSLVSGDNGEYWSKSPEPTFDPNDPLDQLVLARLNNMAIVDGTTLVCAPTAVMIESVLDLIAEGGESAADSPVIAPLIDGMATDTVNIVAVSGEMFRRAHLRYPEMPEQLVEYIDERFMESDDAVGPMPELLSAFSGVGAGAMVASPDEDAGAPDLGDLRAFMSFLAASESDARQAADVTFWRIEHMDSLSTGDPYTDMFDVTNSPDNAVDGPVMTVELGPDNAVNQAWFWMIGQPDHLPVAWGSDDPDLEMEATPT